MRFTLEKQADAFRDGAMLLSLIEEIHKALGPSLTVEEVSRWLEMHKSTQENDHAKPK